MYDLLKKQAPAFYQVKNFDFSPMDQPPEKSNLISIDNDFYPDSGSCRQLLDYVRKGNNALIASYELPEYLMELALNTSDTLPDLHLTRASVAFISFGNEPVPYPSTKRFPFQWMKDTIETEWTGFGEWVFKNRLAPKGFRAIAFLNDNDVTAYTLKYGEGEFIFHSNPILFTNNFLSKRQGYEHASNIFTHLNNGPVFWSDAQFVSGYSDRGGPRNPLKILFSHERLRWSWYLFLFTLLLYIVFRTKREQRVIPLMPVNENSSIEFTKAIGTLYYQNKGYRHTANDRYILFLAEIRQRYHMPTDLADNELVVQLSERSGVGKTVIFNLIKQFRQVRSDPDTNSNHLINLYNAIENYHKRRK
jgi:hypothetical protein